MDKIARLTQKMATAGSAYLSLWVLYRDINLSMHPLFACGDPAQCSCSSKQSHIVANCRRNPRSKD